MDGDTGRQAQREDGDAWVPPRDAASPWREGLGKGFVRQGAKATAEPATPRLRRSAGGIPVCTRQLHWAGWNFTRPFMKKTARTGLRCGASGLLRVGEGPERASGGSARSDRHVPHREGARAGARRGNGSGSSSSRDARRRDYGRDRPAPPRLTTQALGKTRSNVGQAAAPHLQCRMDRRLQRFARPI